MSTKTGKGNLKMGKASWIKAGFKKWEERALDFGFSFTCMPTCLVSTAWERALLYKSQGFTHKPLHTIYIVVRIYIIYVPRSLYFLL